MKIAIIGAGLSGLTTAYRLYKNDIHADVFEARQRVGGRVLTCTIKNYRGEDAIVELGGQNITDGGEAQHIKALIDELSLTSSIMTKSVMLNTLLYNQHQFHDFYDHLRVFMNNHADIDPILDNLALHCKSMGQIVDELFKSHDLLRKAFRARLTAYEGVPVDQQSLYHNIETFRCGLKGGIAPSHETYDHQPQHVIMQSLNHGNAQIPLKIANVLGDRIHLNKVLASVEQQGQSLNLHFADGEIRLYDSVVIAIPVSTWHRIDFTHSGINPIMLDRMQRIVYGQNYKIAVPLPLSDGYHQGSIVFDDAVSFYNHDGTIPLLYVNQPDREMKDTLKAMKTGYTRHANHNDDISPLNAADVQYQAYDNPVHYIWSHNPYSHGSYSGYSTTLGAELDECTSFNGIEFKKIFSPINNHIFFAGEHTTLLDCIGTMEAAVESGERTAAALLNKLHYEGNFNA